MKSSMQRSTGRWLQMRVLMIAYVVSAVSTAYGQAAQPNRGMLMKPQATRMLSAGCTVNKLVLAIRTGNDDLRGGQNNLNVEIHFADGNMQVANNVNQGANWPNNSLRSVTIPLNQPVAPGQIRMLRLVHLAQGGYVSPHQGTFGGAMATGGPPAGLASLASGVKTEDNWNMAELQVRGIGTANVPIASFGFHRFTGTYPSLDVNAMPTVGCPSPDDVRQLEFLFQTGNDDLRGGDDNLDIVINFADGTNQAESNVNQGMRWADGSKHEVTVSLNRSVPLGQIKSVTLAATFKGGMNGDNWNMDSVNIVAVVNGANHLFANSGFHRFSANWTGPDAKSLTIPRQGN